MPKVIFQKSGQEAEWDGSEDSILELGESLGIDLPFGCRQGRCTSCQQPIVSGTLEYPDGHVGEPDPGKQLLCCSVPVGDEDLVIDA
jgi:ferredoxin